MSSLMLWLHLFHFPNQISSVTVSYRYVCPVPSKLFLPHSNWALSANFSKIIKIMILSHEEQFSRLRIFLRYFNTVEFWIEISEKAKGVLKRPSMERKNIWFRNNKPLIFAGLWTRRVNLSLVSPLPSLLPSPGNVSSVCIRILYLILIDLLLEWTLGNTLGEAHTLLLSSYLAPHSSLADLPIDRLYLHREKKN